MRYSNLNIHIYFSISITLYCKRMSKWNCKNQWTCKFFSVFSYFPSYVASLQTSKVIFVNSAVFWLFNSRCGRNGFFISKLSPWSILVSNFNYSCFFIANHLVSSDCGSISSLIVPHFICFFYLIVLILVIFIEFPQTIVTILVVAFFIPIIIMFFSHYYLIMLRHTWRV